MFAFMPPMHKFIFLLGTYLFFAYLCKREFEIVF